MGVILGAFWLCYLPYPSEIIYWFTGMIAYQPGLAMIAFWSVLHFKKDKSKFLQIIYFVLPFLIVGTN
jgi:prolipoprotein diacylglyceryltransferase